jgi:hypothetical protein
MKVGRVAGYAGFAAALVYVLLKAAWIAGSSFGVQDMHGLSRSDWLADNVSTAGLGVVGAIVALATVRPWGMRIPLWLIAVPMWVGAGLLAPFVILMPAAGVFEAAGWWTPPAATLGPAEPTLQPWIFVIVYGSFIVLGAGLAVAFPVYARSRFGTVLQGTVGRVPPGATHQVQAPLAWLAAVLATGLAAVRISWALGGTHRAAAGDAGHLAPPGRHRDSGANSVRDDWRTRARAAMGREAAVRAASDRNLARCRWDGGYWLSQHAHHPGW